MTMSKNEFYVAGFKPFCDRLFSLILLILLFPLMLLLTVMLWIHFGASPLYKQLRPGKESKPFWLLKFKTMKVEDDEASLTSLGKFLRSVSLDELPQLVNVLKGEMSLVGPRPLLMEYLPYYNKDEIKRHEVLPGITGWAQVNGRNTIDWESRMQYDVYYVEQISFKLDLKIFLKTIAHLFIRDKTSYEGKKTIKFSDYAQER